MCRPSKLKSHNGLGLERKKIPERRRLDHPRHRSEIEIFDHKVDLLYFEARNLNPEIDFRLGQNLQLLVRCDERMFLLLVRISLRHTVVAGWIV